MYLFPCPGFNWEEQEAWKFGHSHDPLQQANLQQRIIPMDKVGSKFKNDSIYFFAFLQHLKL